MINTIFAFVVATALIYFWAWMVGFSYTTAEPFQKLMVLGVWGLTVDAVRIKLEIDDLKKH